MMPLLTFFIALHFFTYSMDISLGCFAWFCFYGMALSALNAWPLSALTVHCSLVWSFLSFLECGSNVVFGKARGFRPFVIVMMWRYCC